MIIATSIRLPIGSALDGSISRFLRECLMDRRTSLHGCSGVWAFIVVVPVSFVAVNACGATISAVAKDGHVLSAVADFSASGDTLTLTLTNTTPTTEKVQDLLTGLEFQLLGLTPSLTSVMGIRRTIDEDGAFTD